MDSSDVISFEAPSPFTALTFTVDGILLAGGEDGSLRIYDLSPAAPRALRKAIRGLPHEVTSICSQPIKSGVALGKAWVASGKQAFLFNLESEKLVMNSNEAEDVVTLIGEGEGDEDNVLNQISVFKDSIAYSCDSGSVGVLDTQTKNRKTMRAVHANICGSVVFVPIRPQEIVSGGYDSQLIHFDVSLGTVLSRLDIPAPPSTGDSPISLSPPFLLSIAINSNGVLAAATADGRVIVGRGGERGRQDRSNRRKWHGLNANMVDQYHIAEGPVVGVSWVGPSDLLAVSLGGQVKHFRIPEFRNPELNYIWTASTVRIHKVNGLAVCVTRERVIHIAVGGFTSAGRGCVEIWKRRAGDDTGS